jgi:hypothetical protein
MAKVSSKEQDTVLPGQRNATVFLFGKKKTPMFFMPTLKLIVFLLLCFAALYWCWVRRSKVVLDFCFLD